jgi:hypothetical protein
MWLLCGRVTIGPFHNGTKNWEGLGPGQLNPSQFATPASDFQGRPIDLLGQLEYVFFKRVAVKCLVVPQDGGLGQP